MPALYVYIARIYLLVTALVVPVISLFCWLLLARIRNKRLGLVSHCLVPAAIGQTLTAIAILILFFVTFVDRRDYTLAAVSYLLSILGLIFGVLSFRRVWNAVNALPANLGEPPPGDASSPPHGVWPPPPARPG